MSHIHSTNKPFTCDTCSKKFGYRRSDKGTKTTCPSCYNNRHRFAFKAACIEYKGGSCQLCGYNKCLRALSFHHVDPKTKKFCIGNQLAFSRSRQSTKEELDKCVCLCQNCHAELEDAIAWRQSDSIIALVKKIHDDWKPKEFTFDRRNWQDFHPAPPKAYCPLFAESQED